MKKLIERVREAKHFANCIKGDEERMYAIKFKACPPKEVRKFMKCHCEVQCGLTYHYER